VPLQVGYFVEEEYSFSGKISLGEVLRSLRSCLVLQKNAFAATFTLGDHQFFREIWRFFITESVTKCPKSALAPHNFANSLYKA